MTSVDGARDAGAMRAEEREEIIGAGAREMERLVDAFSTLAVPTTEANEGAEAVSYTHLTLPTILLV